MEVTKSAAARLCSLCIPRGCPGEDAAAAQRAKAGCAKARARRPCCSPQEQIAASRRRLLAKRAGTRRCGWERGRCAPAPHARRKLRRCLAWAPHARPGHHRRPDQSPLPTCISATSSAGRCCSTVAATAMRPCFTRAIPRRSLPSPQSPNRIGQRTMRRWSIRVGKGRRSRARALSSSASLPLLLRASPSAPCSSAPRMDREGELHRRGGERARGPAPPRGTPLAARWLGDGVER
ncbi:unnamed protein product [Urochloa humidicola]